MSEFPFEAYVDGETVEKWFFYTDGETLNARVLPKEDWDKSIKEEVDEPVYLNLFKIPLSEYIDLEEEIDDMKGEETVMGEIPTLTQYRKEEISTNLDNESLYSLIATGKDGGKRAVAGGGRLSTEKDEEIPHLMTLDELKLLAIEDLGLSLEEAKDVKAKIRPMTGWGERGRFIIAGFTFEERDGNDYGIMAQHNGVVSHYHGYSKEEIKEVL